MIKIIKLLALFTFSFNAQACVVLVYHHFSDKTPKSTSISPALFEKHLQYIKANKFSVLTVKELVNKLQNKDKLPNKCAVLTVDDAYTSIYDNAYPLLKKYNMPMSVFVATEVIDKKYGAFMSYENMRKTTDLISYYNHSKSHDYLHTLTKQQVKNDILTAQKRLKDELGIEDKIFAYPYGEYNLEVYNLIKELGFVAFGQHSGAIGLDSDLYTLPRFPMNHNYGKMSSFKTKINTIAMPIITKTIDPVVKENPPTLKLELSNKLNLNCFVNGELIKNIKWDKNTAYIKANDKLPKGRNKYNCTAKSKQQGRYYWFSHQWIVGENRQ